MENTHDMVEARVGFEPTNGGFAVRPCDVEGRGAVVNESEKTTASIKAFRSPRLLGKTQNSQS
jgi:hypothetical protein